jgi:dimethylamine/trimethylamine dehydrogenase
MANVDIYRGNSLTAQDVIDFGCDHAIIATGANWSRELLNTSGRPADEIEGDTIFTPDDILAGAQPDGPVLIYDFDHYYMGSCLAELLQKRGHEVTIATTANAISAWTFMNNELGNIRARMIELGINTIFENYLTGYSDGVATFTSVYPGADDSSLQCGSLVVVGIRKTNDSLYQELASDNDKKEDAGISVIRSIGDCRAPGAIAHAVYSGHECARTIDSDGGTSPFKIERPLIES